MIVVSDASPLIALDSINKLELLPLLYKQVLIPPRVYEEAGTNSLHAVSWLTVVPVEDNPFIIDLLAQGLDRGEAEAIALALQVKAQKLIIDERRGRSVAERLGLELIGTLGLLVKAKQAHLVDEVRPLIDTLIQTISFRISPALYAQILGDCGEGKS